MMKRLKNKHTGSLIAINKDGSEKLS